MAPESVFDRMYTHKSDVWSFGIMCWEMLELGQKPYTNMTLTSVPSAVALGHRLARPQLCTPQLYENIIQKKILILFIVFIDRYKILLRCWHKDPPMRPDFMEILSLLSTLETI